jgi:hypothetical protein
MQAQTVTRAVESDIEPLTLYSILADASNIPAWAHIFADSIKPTGPHHATVTKSGETFPLEILLNPAAATVDYIRPMPNNKRGGAYLRVIPRPLGGSTVIMTVPLAPGATESATARSVDHELTALLQLAGY